MSQNALNADHPLRYRMVIEWSDEDQAYLVILPEWTSVVFQPVTHGATYVEAAEHGTEVLEMLVHGAQADGEGLPGPCTFQPPEEDDESGSRFRGLITSGEDDDDALPYQERIVRMATGKDADEDEDHKDGHYNQSLSECTAALHREPRHARWPGPSRPFAVTRVAVHLLRVRMSVDLGLPPNYRSPMGHGVTPSLRPSPTHHVVRRQAAATTCSDPIDDPVPFYGPGGPSRSTLNRTSTQATAI